MNWQDFKNGLVENSERYLQVQYDEGKLIEPTYHITEIKTAEITSVDCGGNISGWKETIVQFVEYEKGLLIKPMQISKALSIIQLVESKISISPESTVKIEFGNNQKTVSQMIPESLEIHSDELTIRLVSDSTGCKPSLTGIGNACSPKILVASSREQIWKQESKVVGCC
jgi:Family of unknown function (DUF6428)